MNPLPVKVLQPFLTAVTTDVRVRVDRKMYLGRFDPGTVWGYAIASEVIFRLHDRPMF